MGKSTKTRNCPALGREILSVECGRNRGVKYECPTECPYCPWTPDNYDDFLEIEGRIDNATFGFYESVVGSREYQNQFMLTMEETNEPLAEMKIHEICFREFYLRDFGSGKKFFDLWRDSGWTGLSRDEPFLASFKARSRVALLEVRRLIDEKTTECVDLLRDSQAPLILLDRGLSKQARVFQCVVAWICEYPFFHRLHGVCHPVPNSVESARDRVLKIAGESGGPMSIGPELNDWLQSHYAEVVQDLSSLEKNRVMGAIKNSDFKNCVAVYRWRKEVQDLNLQGRSDFCLLPEDATVKAKYGPHQNYVWLRMGASATRENQLPVAMRAIPGVPGDPVWGHLHVYPDRVEVLAFAEVLFRPMREMVEDFFSGDLVFEKEFVVDLAKQKFSGESGDMTQQLLHTVNFFRDQSVDARKVLKQSLEARLRHALDIAIPALGGLTPREASRQPGSRELLVNWMKGYIVSMDSISKKECIVIDWDWVLDELGLAELKAPCSGFQASRGWWWEVDAEEIKTYLETSNDLERADMRLFPQAVEYYESMSPKTLSSGELDHLLQFADFIVGILVPPGILPAPIEGEDIRKHFGVVIDEIADDAAANLLSDAPELLLKMLESLMARSPQPVLLMYLAAMLAALDMDKKNKVRKEKRFPLLLQLEALIRSIRDIAL